MSRAIVLGGGIAGIAAAAALRAAHDEVIIVERDRIEDGSPRRGVPHAGQLHNLLSAAHESLEQLLPGFRAALVRAGGISGRVSADTYVFELGTRMPERDLGLHLFSAPRLVVESVARELALKNGGVTQLDGTTVLDISLEDREVRGVVCRNPEGREFQIDAPLVVDATGTQSRTLSWLNARGVRVDVDHRQTSAWYASARYCLPDIPDSRFWLVFPHAASRGGLASPAGNGCFVLSVSGREGDIPPLDHTTFLQYARSLEDPVLGEMVASGVPLTAPRLFRRGTASWRHFESAEDLPRGLVVIGDAMAALDPLLGQGISVAALEAVALARLAVELSPDEPSFGPRYFRSAAAAISLAWELGGLGTGAGPHHPLVGDSAYGNALVRAMEADAELHGRYVGIWHLVEPLAILDEPEVRDRILAHSTERQPRVHGE